MKHFVKCGHNTKTIIDQYNYLKDSNEGVLNSIATYTEDSCYLDFEGAIEILKLFKSVPVMNSPITVYRGLQDTKLEDFRSDMESFISTSLSKEIAYDFSRNGILLEITIPIGSKILPILDYSSFPKQCEILLDGYNYSLITTQHESVTTGYLGITEVYDRFKNVVLNVDPCRNIQLIKCVLKSRDSKDIKQLYTEIEKKHPRFDD